jgi:hypothetical protein
VGFDGFLDLNCFLLRAFQELSKLLWKKTSFPENIGKLYEKFSTNFPN